MFAGLATSWAKSGGLIRARGGNTKTLSFAAVDGDGISAMTMLMDVAASQVDDEKLLASTKANTAIPKNVLSVDDASVTTPTMPDVDGDCPVAMLRWIKNLAGGATRVAREAGNRTRSIQRPRTFYELPADNAGGVCQGPGCGHSTIDSFMIPVPSRPVRDDGPCQ